MKAISHLKKIKKRSAFDFSFPYNIVAAVTNPFFFVRRNLYRNIRGLSERLSGVLLDFGCGCKPYQELFVNVTEYIGLDIEQSGHDHDNEDIDVYYDGEHIPFDDGYFDSLFSSEVYEHVPNMEIIFPELNRVLKNGGVMIASLPFVWNEHETPYDFQRFTSYGIKKRLEEMGFEVEEIVKSTGYIQVLFQMWNEYLRHSFAKLSNRKVLTFLVQLILIFPSTVIGHLTSLLLPDNDSLYGDCIVVCRKVKELR